jgi:hypothetical protein
MSSTEYIIQPGFRKLELELEVERRPNARNDAQDGRPDRKIRRSLCNARKRYEAEAK